GTECAELEHPGGVELVDIRGADLTERGPVRVGRVSSVERPAVFWALVAGGTSSAPASAAVRTRTARYDFLVCASISMRNRFRGATQIGVPPPPKSSARILCPRTEGRKPRLRGA